LFSEFFLSQVDLKLSVPHDTVAEMEMDQTLAGRSRIERHVFEKSHHLSLPH